METEEKIVKTVTTYKRSRTKAKEVKFSDFRKNDPVLSRFENLDEPKIPTNYCTIKPNNIID